MVWEDYDEFDITYMIEGSYITFNDIAFQLAGAPWVIKSYTKNHITLIQNEASPDKEKVAIIELDRIDLISIVLLKRYVFGCSLFHIYKYLLLYWYHFYEMDIGKRRFSCCSFWVSGSEGY